ncbi:biotin--[acetyl-CoA-carboxylase] ligase [Geminicoccus roseus]|uniref:biotin--[acetyl-CoA-carboxylase] ligase n=1 Tax=Geminicoccus roseus TaxID=404900 RepID=UPI0004269497|nr:biotin--[acetyl-CoA-carboxylase] ligase [Geminicoccus roseus]
MPSSAEPGEAGPFWRIEHHATLPSTSDLVRARAQQGAAEGLVVVAGQQTAGRGRHGRGWTSPLGNLYLTLLLRPSVPVQEAGGLALVAGLSLAEACVALGAPHGQFRLKWPNDLVHGSAKVAGILLEAEPDGAQRIAWVSIGIGVNVAEAPAVSGRESAALADLLPGCNVAVLQQHLLEQLYRNYMSWQRLGMPAVIGAWSSHGLEPGTAIMVKPGRDLLAGRYLGVDSDGALLVDTGDVRRITTGEVLFAGEALAATGPTA